MKKLTAREQELFEMIRNWTNTVEFNVKYELNQGCALKALEQRVQWLKEYLER